jgi:hypothetical protein
MDVLMASFHDLEPLTYFGERAAGVLRAVGWLESGDPIPSGESDPAVYGRLGELLADPFQPFACAGKHECSLCLFRPESRGSANLFVPADGFLYVCPELILHYMNVHRYAPPGEFCAALLACPDTRTSDYKRAFLANGGRALMRSIRE